MVVVASFMRWLSCNRPADDLPTQYHAPTFQRTTGCCVLQVAARSWDVTTLPANPLEFLDEIAGQPLPSISWGDFHIDVPVGRVVVVEEPPRRHEFPVKIEPPFADRFRRVSEYGRVVLRPHLAEARFWGR